MIALANDAKMREGMAASIMADLVGKYTRPEELQFAAFNMPAFSKLVPEAQVLCQAQTKEASELLGLLKKLEQALSERKAAIASAYVTDYQSFRNKSLDPMPRLACMIDLSGLDMMDYDAMESMNVLAVLLSEAGNYGIHVMLFWTLGEHLFSIDVETLFDVKFLSSLTEQDFYNIGMLTLTPDEKEYQQQPKHALVVTKDDIVKLQVGTNAK